MKHDTRYMTIKKINQKFWYGCYYLHTLHIVPFGKFHRIGGASPETMPNVKYDAPEEVGGNRKCFESPIKKLGLVQVLDVNSSRALILCSLTVFFCP